MGWRQIACAVCAHGTTRLQMIKLRVVLVAASARIWSARCVCLLYGCVFDCVAYSAGRPRGSVSCVLWGFGFAYGVVFLHAVFGERYDGSGFLMLKSRAAIVISDRVFVISIN